MLDTIYQVENTLGEVLETKSQGQGDMTSSSQIM